MGIEKRKGSNVIICDRCGRVISWEINSNIKHGYVCSNCLDKDYGKFRVVDIFREEFEPLIGKEASNNLTDEEMSVISDVMMARLQMSDEYFIGAMEAFDKLGYEISLEARRMFGRE